MRMRRPASEESTLMVWLGIGLMMATGALALYGAAQLNDWLPSHYTFCNDVVTSERTPTILTGPNMTLKDGTPVAGPPPPEETIQKACGWPK